MLQSSTVDFLKQLTDTNTKEWFETNKKLYDAAKKDHEAYVNEVLQAMMEREEGFSGQKVKDCVFRIFRDVRFSKNKTPYKTNFGAVFAKGGKKTPGAGYYVHLEPGKSFVGGGIWNPENDVLKKIRQEVDYNLQEFESILKEKNFSKLFKSIDGEKLKKAPQGYDEANPAIDYLKMKSFTVGTAISDADVLGKNFTDKTLTIFTAMKPFIDFLNRSVE